MRKIWIPILSLVVSALILLGLYNGLKGVRQANIETELKNKMIGIKIAFSFAARLPA